MTSDVQNNSLTSPEGLVSATRLRLLATSGTNIVTPLLPATIGNSYTASVFIKGRVVGQYVTIYFNGTNFAPLVTMVDTTKYVRYEMTGLATAATISLQIDNDGIDLNADLNNQELLDCDLWGAQIESGARATTPLITNGSAITRGADELKITDLSWLNRIAGTFVISVVVPNVLPEDGKYFFGLSNGGMVGAVAADGIYLLNSQGKTAVEVVTGGVSVISSGSLRPNWQVGGNLKIALKYDAGMISIYENGTFAGQISNSTLPQGLNLLTLGYSGGHGGQSYLNGFMTGFKFSDALIQNQDLVGLSSF